jgi:hypothetical protein
MRRVTSVLVLAIAMQCSAHASQEQFAGKWKNVDPDTGGITKLEIVFEGDLVRVHAWGKCHPEDCDWGTVVAIAYGQSVDSDVSDTVRTIAAVFKTSFNQSLLVIHAGDQGRVKVEVLTHFTDGSGRSPYSQVHTMAR